MFSNIRSFLHSCDLKPSKRTFCNSQAFSTLDFLRGRISILPCPFTASAAGSRSLCGQSPQPQEVPGTSGDMLLTHTFLAHSLDLAVFRSWDWCLKRCIHPVDQGNSGLRSQGPLHGLKTWEAGGLKMVLGLPSPRASISNHLSSFPGSGAWGRVRYSLSAASGCVWKVWAGYSVVPDIPVPAGFGSLCIAGSGGKGFRSFRMKSFREFNCFWCSESTESIFRRFRTLLKAFRFRKVLELSKGSRWKLLFERSWRVGAVSGYGWPCSVQNV